MRDKNEYVQRFAAEALEKINPKWPKSKEAKKQVPEFISALRDKNEDVRKSAADALGKINPEWPKSEEAKKQVPEFISALRDKYWQVRESAAKALGKIGDPRAVEALISALRDENEYVREYAAEALGKIGKPAVEPLISALRDEDSWVRAPAARALGMIADPKAVEALISALRDSYPWVRESAAEALEKIYKLQWILLKSYPNLICTKDFFRAKKKRIDIFKKYVLCQVCGSSIYLATGIKKVIGVIGGDIKDYKIDEDKIYVNLWDNEKKQPRGADIDILEINNDNLDYDWAINDVIVKTKNVSQKNKKIDVIIKGNPPLSISLSQPIESKNQILSLLAKIKKTLS